MSPGAKILIVDDAAESREGLAEMVSAWGHRPRVAADGREALRIAAEQSPDVLVSDLVMPGMDGIDLLRSLRDEHPECVAVILTGQGTIDVAVEAIRKGAYDFIVKPLEPQRLRLILDRALERLLTQREVLSLKGRLKQLGGAGHDFIGHSLSMRRVFELIEKVAPSKASVVITGQSGTGKEMVARAVHNLSPRKDRAFIAINCSAIPPTLMESELFGYEKGAFTGADGHRPGCFELADKGTLFLDEVGEMPVELQPKLLRVLEEERLRRLGGKTEVEVDVRVICATHRDFRDEIKAGRFREDLFFRLNVFQVQLPLLRERVDDIPVLAQHFVEKFNRESSRRLKGVDAHALEIMKRYPWPGNIRELRNAVERAVILCDGDTILPEHLPPDMAGRPSDDTFLRVNLGLPLEEVEKAYILTTLSQSGGNKARTAERLGISEKTLYNRLRQYREESFRAAPAEVIAPGDGPAPTGDG
jgi:DNA-binding NtrC family response regulator